MPAPCVQKWINENQGKHLCACGCGKSIPIKYFHRWEGIPKYLHTHWSKKHQIKNLENAFWEKVIKTKDCWLWNGAGNRYGQLRHKGIEHKAHRVSWIIHFGPIKENLHVLHKCDNPRCVNPAHLFLGTHQDNMADMVRKKRYAKGEQVGCSRLIAEDIREIRRRVAAGETLRKVATAFKTDTGHICKIVHRKRWSHIA